MSDATRNRVTHVWPETPRDLGEVIEVKATVEWPGVGGRPALDFLTPDRFDIPAKTLYAWYRDRGIRCDWGEFVYAAHLKAWNGFHEREPEKNGFADYKKSFNKILNQLASNTFDFTRCPISLKPNFRLRNGSHRIAGAILYDVKIPEEDLQIEPWKRGGKVYTYKYFREKMDIVPTGLNLDVSDAIALEYCRLLKEKNCLYIAILFPSAKGKDKEAEEIIKEHGEIVYHKNVFISNGGAPNLIQQIYNDESWLGNLGNGFSGAGRKASACYSQCGPTRVYLIESDSIERMDKAKHIIRNLYDIGKHSIHICDTMKEVTRIGRIVFNRNSIDFMNHMTTNRYFKNFWKLMTGLREDLDALSLDESEMCVVGSAPLAAFGIRDARDFDFVKREQWPEYRSESKISSHSGQLKYYGLNEDQIIFDPNNHFWYKNIKFCTLDVVREMKINRWEDKDKTDVAAINEFTNNYFCQSTDWKTSGVRRKKTSKAVSLLKRVGFGVR